MARVEQDLGGSASLPFPVAAALVHGRLGPLEISGEALRDPRVLRLSESMVLTENDTYNAAFPARRFAHASIATKDGGTFVSGATEALGDPESPLSDAHIRSKYMAIAEPVLGHDRCRAIESAVMESVDLAALLKFIHAPAEQIHQIV